MLKRVSIAVVMTALALVGCSTMGRAAAEDSEAPAGRLTQHGELELLNVTTTPSINSLTFRGTARNPYDEPIEGIRLVLQIRSDPTPGSPELAHAQKSMDAQLAAGDHTAFDIEAKVNPASLAQPGFFLRAFAVSRGGEKLPVPPGWQE